MKLEAITRVEDSKMDSKETASEQPVESVKHGVNGNGVENGNGHGTTNEISQNGEADMKQKSKSDISASEGQDSNEEESRADSSPPRATRSSSKQVSDGEGVTSESSNTTPETMDTTDNSKDASEGGKDTISDNKDIPVDSKEAESEPMETEGSVMADEKRDSVSEKKADSEEKDEMKSDSNNKMDEVASPLRATRSASKRNSDCDASAEKSEKVAGGEDPQSTDCLSPRRSSRICSLEKKATESKTVDADPDLEKVKSGGLTLKLDSGEEFSVQLADDDEEEEAKSHCKTPEAESDDDVTVVKVESKPKPKAEIHVKYSGPTGIGTIKAQSKAPVVCHTMPIMRPNLGAMMPTFLTSTAPMVTGTTNMISTGGNVLVPVQFPSTSLLKPGQQMGVPVLMNTQVAGIVPTMSRVNTGIVPTMGQVNTGIVPTLGQVNTVKSVASTTYKPASTAYKPAPTVQVTTPTITIDPVAAANYARAKEAHAKKVAEFEKLSKFLGNMRNKVTVKNTVDALRGHIVKVPEYRRVEVAKNKALAWKTDTDNTSEVSGDTDREKSATPVVGEDGEDKDDDKTETESETTDIEMETTNEKPTQDAKVTDVEMKEAEDKEPKKAESEVKKDSEEKEKDAKSDDGEKEAVEEEKEDEVKMDETGEDEEGEKSKEKPAVADADKAEKSKDDEKEAAVADADKAEKSKDDEKEAAVADTGKAEEKSKDDETDTAVADADKAEEKSKDDEKVAAEPAVADADRAEEGSEKSKDTPATNNDEKKVSDQPKLKADAAPAGEKGDHEEAAKKLRPVARFLYYSGLDLAREYIYKDLLGKQEVLLDKKKLHFDEEEDYYRLRRIYSTYRRKNKPMHPKVKKCRSCTFQTESSNAMHYHQEHGHVDLSVGRYECALCDFESKAASAFKFHMEAEHDMVGRVTVKPCFWHCDLCPYEHNNKAMVIKHKMKCGKKFDIKKHLFPTYDDINFLFRALPGPSIGANPALTPPVVPKPAGSAWSTIGPKTVYNKPYNTLPASYSTVASIKPQVPQVVTYMTNNGPVRVQLNPSKPMPQLPLTTSKTALIQHLTTPANRAILPTSVATLGKRPAAPVTIPIPPAKVARSELEICEICGGFIKDRHSLRLHFKMAHCIEIDESVITSKHTAPLSCDVCMKRFWTFQGLTMHRVAMNHIPQTNTKSMRGSKCFICSVFVADIMKHINSTHNMIPGQLNTIRICPVCGHTMSPGNLVSHLKLLHNMILPVPTSGAVSNPPPAASPDNKKVYCCPSCKRSFISIQTLNNHIDQCHSYKCHLCDFRCTSLDIYKNHITKGHKKTAKQCTVCNKNFIGAAYTVHVQKEHCRKFSIKMERCDYLVDLFKGALESNDKAATATSGLKVKTEI
jgi:hypothetical protein